MGMPKFTDALIIEAIEKGGAALEEVMRYLYTEHEYRAQIFAFILAREGNKEDAEDIFQDGIRNLIINVRSKSYTGKGSITGYLYGICKNLWYKRFQKKQRQSFQQEQLNVEEIDEQTPEVLLLTKDQENQLEELLAQLGDTCREVLELWKLSYSMKEIAEKTGYKNEAVARKKKRLCLQKLLRIMEQQPQWKIWLK